MMKGKTAESCEKRYAALKSRLCGLNQESSHTIMSTMPTSADLNNIIKEEAASAADIFQQVSNTYHNRPYAALNRNSF